MSKELSRRVFIRNLAIGAGGVIVLGSYGFHFEKSGTKSTVNSIVIDFNKCTGCRTCEIVCASSNHTVEINGEKLSDLGNPFLSNIRVSHYNPDVDIPNVCQLCPDSPCIEACPINPDPITGRKALYKDEKLGAIMNDTQRCIGCMKCAEACKTERRGVIIPNPISRKPERTCTMCGGDPQCVKHCPYGAISVQKVDVSGEFFGKSPQEISKVLFERFYEMS